MSLIIWLFLGILSWWWFVRYREKKLTGVHIAIALPLFLLVSPITFVAMIVIIMWPLLNYELKHWKD